MAPRPSSRASTSSSTTGRRESIRRPSRSGLSPSPPSMPRPHGPPAGLSRRPLSPKNDDERLELAAACPVALPAVFDYHPHVPARRPLPALRSLRGRIMPRHGAYATRSDDREGGRYLDIPLERCFGLPPNITGGNVSPRRLATVIRRLREQRD